MTVWICATCGIEHPDTASPPAGTCVICADERQWVPMSGQRWTTSAELTADGHAVSVDELEPDLYGLTATPPFGIGQRGLLVRTGGGNLLWEPPGVIDAAALERVRSLGGVAAVTASHPHLVGASVSWSAAFGGAPVLVADADRRWVRRPDPAVRSWTTAHQVLPGLTLVPCGGHFAGSCVAHWAAGAAGRGVLLTGDTIAVGADRASVSAMRSYPNLIPLPDRAIRRIRAAVQPYPFDRVYSGFAVLDADAAAVVAASLDRYVAWSRGEVTDPDEPSGHA